MLLHTRSSTNKIAKVLTPWGGEFFLGALQGVKAVGVKLSQRGFDTILIYVESQPIGSKQAEIVAVTMCTLRGLI
jgi:hypothetical protein